jgi:hypothetical protein
VSDRREWTFPQRLVLQRIQASRGCKMVKAVKMVKIPKAVTVTVVHQ